MVLRQSIGPGSVVHDVGSGISSTGFSIPSERNVLIVGYDDGAATKRFQTEATLRRVHSFRYLTTEVGFEGPVEVTPTALNSNICLVSPPGLVGWIEMTAQPLFQLGTVTLNPPPDHSVIRR